MQLALAAKRHVRILATSWAAMLVMGALYMVARGDDPFADWPLPARLLGQAMTVVVVWAWVGYAVRLHTVLHLDAERLGVRRVYPPLDHAYAWADLREWRYAAGGRGEATLRLTFNGGRRLTIYPAAYNHADQLLRQLEAVLPGEGDRVRIGRRSAHTVAAT
jgi:hypothetical protein